MIARASTSLIRGCLHGCCSAAGIWGRSGRSATLELAQLESVPLSKATAISHRPTRKGFLIAIRFLLEGFILGRAGQFTGHGLVKRLGADGSLAGLFGGHGSLPLRLVADGALVVAVGIDAENEQQDQRRSAQPSPYWCEKKEDAH